MRFPSPTSRSLRAMTVRSRSGIRLLTAVLALCLIATTACGSEPDAASQVGVASSLQPTEDGFAFANFPSSSYPEQFDGEELVAMFGADPAVCVDGVAEPCRLTAEAAAFARMVNQSRAAGHCEGLTAVSQARFNARSEPQTVVLPDDEETISAIMRAFATQFVPEVRDEVERWLSTSLDDKIEAVRSSLAGGELTYSLGLYDDDGGHSVLPFAVEYPAADRARIMVYDSNWPGRNRYVDVDLAADTWTFAFAGDSPANDPDPWTGGSAQLDLTDIASRSGSCPFCSSDVGIAKNVLLVRSTDLSWSLATGSDTVSPAEPTTSDGTAVTPFKGQFGGGRAAYDFLASLPTEPSGELAQLTLPGTSSVFALTPAGIAQITSPGNATTPIGVGTDGVASADPAVTLSLAAGNLAVTASGPSARLSTGSGRLTATVTSANGQVVAVDVTPDQPAASVVADATSGAVTVLAQTADGVTQRREIAPDGTETVSIEPTPLNLGSPTWTAPPGLESVPLPMLPPPEARNLNNPTYAADEPYVAPAGSVRVEDTPTTTDPTVTPPSTEPPTTDPPGTAPPTTASSPTTISPLPATQPPATEPPTTDPPETTPPPTTTPPTTAPPPIDPNLELPPLPPSTFGDPPLNVTASSDSPAPVTFSSSNSAIASIDPTGPTSAKITLKGAGSLTIRATQPAVGRFAGATRSRILTIERAQQTPLTLTSSIGLVGASLALSATGGSSGGDVTYALTEGNEGCTVTGNQLRRATTGVCTLTATRAADALYRAVTSAPATFTFVDAIHGTVDEGGTLQLVAPSGTRFASVTFASYGTPQGVPGSFTIGTCHADNSVAVVAGLAVGKSSVAVAASNALFGNPCGGTPKRLAISLALEAIP